MSQTEKKTVITDAVNNKGLALRVHSVSKKYGNHLALDKVNLELNKGEVHIIFGENGAGKSTLISIIAGANQPTAGTLEIGSYKGVFKSVSSARESGVRAVFQEFSLVPSLSVGDNINLGEEKLSKFYLLEKEKQIYCTQKVIDELGFDLNAKDIISSLPRGKQQMVEICKAVLQQPKVLILDEPTASLSDHDTNALFRLINKLKKQGTAIVYITHRMHEIEQIGDVVTVLRDGKYIATIPADTAENEMIHLMTGRSVDEVYPQRNFKTGKTLLKITNLSSPDGSVKNVNLEARSGEIVGIAGLVGCGKSELGQTCFGLTKASSGKIEVNNNEVDIKHPSDAISKGIWYSPADRKRDGLSLVHAADKNMSLSSLSFGEHKSVLVNSKKEQELVSRISGSVEFPNSRIKEEVGNFSGGNQQKALLAKSLAQNAQIYIFDEPTVGVDINARKSIYKYIHQLSEVGAAVVLISSDLSELIGLSDRILVMRNGSIVHEFDKINFDQHSILEYFFE